MKLLKAIHTFYTALKRVRFLFIALALVCSFNANAQLQNKKVKRHYFEGYLITNFNDTIIGRIKAQDEYHSKVKMIPDNLGKKISVNLDRIKEMQINILTFEKITVNGKEKFLECVAKGYYKLFAYKFYRADVAFTYYYLLLKGETINVLPENFAEIVPPLVEDNEQLSKLIADKTLGYDQIVAIFRSYNLQKKD